MSHQLVLQVHAADPLAAGLDQVLRTILDHHHAQRVDGRDVPGVEPAVALRGCRGCRIVVVAAGDPCPAHHEPARLAGAPRQLAALVILDAELRQRHHAPAAGHRVVLPLHVVELLIQHHMVRGAKRRRFRHAPSDLHVQAVAAVQAGQHRSRRGAAAHEQRAQGRRDVRCSRSRGAIQFVEQPRHDRRHTSADCHTLLGRDAHDRHGVGEDAHEHLLRAGHRAGVRIAPGVDVEHRHDRHDHVATADAQEVGAEAREAVQHDGAVAVQHALRVARGAAGVAHAAGLPLVDLRIAVRGRVTADELLVIHRACRQAAGHESEHHDRGHVRRMLPDQRNHPCEHVFDEQDLVIRVIQDVRDLLQRQADVDHVADRTD